MANTYTAIATVTVGSGGAADITFSSIPATYTDLALVLSLRSAGTGTPYARARFNGTTTGYSNRRLNGNGTTTGSGSPTDAYIILGVANTATQTTSTFSSHSVYIPNYAGSNNKSTSSDSASENNATEAYIYLMAGLWSNSAAITSIAITEENAANWGQYSTATLYGIKNS
jgi:hypothetical protein